MTIPFRTTRYATRLASRQADLLACQKLRHLTFLGTDGVDADGFDAACRHLMVEDQTGRLLACMRLFVWPSGASVDQGYTAQSYDLCALAKVEKPMIELGRFCTAPDADAPDVLRMAWGALTRIVDHEGVTMLFGCSSFQGVDPAPYGAVFAQLARKHQGPKGLHPGRKAVETIGLDQIAPEGRASMPPLLRSYLAMGGWVGDHAVVDRSMNTLHVFTCLEVAKVPPSRARVLRALAQDAPLS